MKSVLISSFFVFAQAVPNGWQKETSPPKCGANIYNDVFIEKILTDGTVQNICGECMPSTSTPSHSDIHFVFTGINECKGFSASDGEEPPNSNLGFDPHTNEEACAKACFNHFNDPGEHGFIYGRPSQGDPKKCYCEKGSVGGNEANNDPLEPCDVASDTLMERYEYTTACASAPAPAPAPAPDTTPPEDESSCNVPWTLFLISIGFLLYFFNRITKLEKQIRYNLVYNPV